MAYVSFSDPANAVDAYKALDKKSFQGRLLHILPAVDRKGNVTIEEGAGKKMTVREDRDAKRKTMAGKDFNWSMLYMNVRTIETNIFAFKPLISFCRVTLWCLPSPIA